MDNIGIKKVSGLMLCMPDPNIDTDIIIPARFLKCLVFDELGPAAFIDDREKVGPTHPFNRLTGAKILLADEGFGSGSSREHAPWSIKYWGIEAVIAKSYGTDIFHGNAVNTEIVCVTVTDEVFNFLSDHCKDAESLDQLSQVTIDLEAMTVTLHDSHSGGAINFCCEMPENLRKKLTLGMTTFNATTIMLANLEKFEDSLGGQ